MDIDLAKAKVESDIRAVDAWVADPLTQKLMEIAQEQSELLMNVLLENPVHNIETYFAREQAFGHLRGLRHIKNFVRETREELQEKLNEIPK